MLSRLEASKMTERQETAAPAGLTSAMRALAAWALVDDGDRVLDMSCEGGALLAHLRRQADCNACGICESFEGARATRAKLPDADVLFAPPEDIPWRDGAFDVVMCPIPLHAMENPGHVLREAQRVLKPGGQFLLAAPWLPTPLRQAARALRGAHYYDAREMTATLETLDYQKVSWHTLHLGMGVAVGWKRASAPAQE